MDKMHCILSRYLGGRESSIYRARIFLLFSHYERGGVFSSYGLVGVLSGSLFMSYFKFFICVFYSCIIFCLINIPCGLQ